MAVCNIFSPISNSTGTFLMFSQYIEDLSEYRINKSNANISPSSFYALNVDCVRVRSKIKELYSDLSAVNDTIPGMFQNRFENIWAYFKDHPEANKYTGTNNDMTLTYTFTSLFWSFMYDNNFLEIDTNNIDTNNIDTNNKGITNIVYKGQISLESYNDHNNMGYGELFCHIPSLNSVKTYKYNADIENITGGPDAINSEYLVGFDENTSKSIPLKSQLENGKLRDVDKNIPLKYVDVSQGLDISNANATKFDINMIVVCYSKNGKEIPMGVYFPGVFEDDHITNTKTIYISNGDIFGGSTTYGLRICTRFSAHPNDSITVVGGKEDKDAYSGYSELFSKMSDTIDKMNEVIKSANVANANVANIYSVLKNNKTNVPYIKEINGVKYWFVNGRKIYAMDAFKTISNEEIQADYDSAFGKS